MTAAIPSSIAVYELDAGEREAIDGLVGELANADPSAGTAPWLADARQLAFARLPTGLVQFLDRFQRTEFAPAVAITGLVVDDRRIGPTPRHWTAQPDRRSTFREEAFLVLAGSVLGDLFSWATLQAGGLVQDVLPIQHQEQEQSGHGSAVTLAWHTEDGFHPYRCDYLGLLSLRNDDRVPTTFAMLDAASLAPSQRRTLGEARFVIFPDNEHLYQRAREGGEEDAPAEMSWARPAPTAVLFGDARLPYLRIDPYFMSAVAGDDQAAEALRAIVQQLDDALQDLVLEPGTICLIDNYRAVHGRAPFRARYDGRDRWLKKIVVTRDLRKSRGARERPDGRVLTMTATSGGG